MIFVYLEKACDRVSREVMVGTKKNVIHNMYEGFTISDQRGENWSPPRFGTKHTVIRHCNGCYTRRRSRRTTPCNVICG